MRVEFLPQRSKVGTLASGKQAKNAVSGNQFPLRFRCLTGGVVRESIPGIYFDEIVNCQHLQYA